MNENRICKACGAALRGRSDKKFCNDYCRSNHNNNIRLESRAGVIIKETNKLLLKNYRILEGIASHYGSMGKVERLRLLLLGFNFHIYTSKVQDASGRDWIYCYDLAYMSLGNGWMLVCNNEGNGRHAVV